MNIYLYISIILAAVAALVHSYLGEAKFFRPLFAETHIGVMRSLTWRRVLRAVWHLPLVCWLLMAAMTFVIAQNNSASKIPLYFACGVYLSSGIGNFIATRGKSFGWIVLFAAAGLLVLGLA
jgi:hypothetical protein